MDKARLYRRGKGRQHWRRGRRGRRGSVGWRHAKKREGLIYVEAILEMAGVWVVLPHTMQLGTCLEEVQDAM